MNFQCKNCGGNMIFAPARQKMYCPYCEGEDTETVAGNDSLTVCASCGAEVDPGEYKSSDKCPYCGNFLVFNKRVEGDYKPDSIIPFKLDKDMAVAAMDKEFKKRLFAPVSFLSEKSLESIKGAYVPFFLYDYLADSEFSGEGTKVKRWSSGNYDYTETSYYSIERVMHASFDNIPVDASLEMDDYTMDLMEPYDYSELMSFDPKYLSGFFGEIYNDTADKFADRAKKKAADSAEVLMKKSIGGYNSMKTLVDRTTLTDQKIDYALFPVWVYKYRFRGKDFNFYVNGQTGKVIGKTPVSVLKVIIYSVFSGLLFYGGIEGLLGIITGVFR